MKRILSIAILSVLFSLSARAEVLERIAGVVNGQPITLTDVLDRAQVDLMKADKLQAAEREKARQEILHHSLDVLVDERLIESEASGLGIEVSDEDQNKSIEALARQNGLTVDQFKEELTKQKVDFNLVKDSLRRQALRFKLLQAKVKPRKITEEELKAAYAARIANPEFEVRARHLFVRIPTAASAEQIEAARQRAVEAQRRLRSGEEFALVARALSEGPTAKEGGDLGYFKKGMLLPEMEGYAFRLQPGETSPVFKTAAGFHLIKVEEKRPLPSRPIAEMADEIRGQINNDSVVQEQVRFLTQLRKSAQVDLRL